VRVTKKFKIELLHPHDNLSKIVAGFSGKIAGVKIVAHCHDLLNKRPVERMLLYYQLIFMDRIIAVSDSVADLFRINGKIPKKIKRIYNAIDLEKFSPDKIKCVDRIDFGIKENNFVLGIVGFLDECKGHIYLFRAIKTLLLEGRRDIKCLVIGNGKLEKELKEFVTKEGLEGNIVFLGYRENIPDFLGIIDVLVIPSIQESFGMVALEGMAMSIPVIATTIGGLPELIVNGHTGLLVPAKDSIALAQAIQYLIDNPEERVKIGKAGRKRAEEWFSIENNAREITELYTNLLNGGK
jgi:glycosyltransferase involved in cell wall biosynthesis